MDDEADVRLVDAHAKGDRRHDHADAAGHEVVLGLVPVGDARVIVAGGDGLLAQERGQFLTAGAGAGIDDAAARFGAAEGQQVAQLLVGVAGVEDLQLQVGAGDVTGDDAHIAQVVEDISSHAGWSCGGHGQERRDAQCLPGAPDGEIVGAEVVAPDADAMRLVNHQPAHSGAPHGVQEGRLAQALGGGVDQSIAALVCQIQSPMQFRALQAAVDGCRPLAQLCGQGVHLILHQGDEG